MKTYTAKAGEVAARLVRRRRPGQGAGPPRVQIALRLRGKHKPTTRRTWTPATSSSSPTSTSSASPATRPSDKLYHRHTRLSRRHQETNFAKMQARFPGRVLEKAVKGMLPKGPLGYAMLKKLKIYAGARASALGAAAEDTGDLDHDRQLLLRHGPAQDVGGARVPQAGHGQVRRQRQAGRRVLRAARPAAWSCASRSS